MSKKRVLLVGIGDKKGVGKDTFAGLAKKSVTKFYHECVFYHDKAAFAEAVKDVTAVKFGIERHLLDDEHFKRQISPYGMTWRKILQTEGTEHSRDFYSDRIWVDRVEDQFKKFVSDFEELDFEEKMGIFCITDCRFDNEAKWVKEMSKKFDNVDSIVVKITLGDDKSSDTHSSEAGLSEFDHLVVNDGTLDDLQEECNQIIHPWVRKTLDLGK